MLVHVYPAIGSSVTIQCFFMLDFHYLSEPYCPRKRLLPRASARQRQMGASGVLQPEVKTRPTGKSDA
jgi:hypothetical protein